MGCAPTRILCPGSIDRGVSHVSKNLSLTPRMKHTRVPPNDTQGYQTACYRNIVDTKPLCFSKSNSESYRKSNRKPERAEWTEPKI